jgi:hypothetical protein
MILTASYCTFSTFFLTLKGIISLILKTDCYEEGTYVNGSCCGYDRVCRMWKQYKEG